MKLFQFNYHAPKTLLVYFIASICTFRGNFVDNKQVQFSHNVSSHGDVEGKLWNTRLSFTNRVNCLRAIQTILRPAHRSLAKINGLQIWGLSAATKSLQIVFGSEGFWWNLDSNCRKKGLSKVHLVIEPVKQQNQANYRPIDLNLRFNRTFHALMLSWTQSLPPQGNLLGWCV